MTLNEKHITNMQVATHYVNANAISLQYRLSQVVFRWDWRGGVIIYACI